MCALPRHYLTPEEYLALERQATTKSEYLGGEVYAMGGATYAHTTIIIQHARIAGPPAQARIIFTTQQRSADQRACDKLLRLSRHCRPSAGNHSLRIASEIPC